MPDDGQPRTIRMQSFPASWLSLEASGLLKKVQVLLQRFGALQEESLVLDKSDPADVIVKATFAQSADALSAKDCLHGVDMRPQAEKQRAPPTEKDKFQVQLVTCKAAEKPVPPDAEGKKGAAFARRALRPGETTFHLRLSGLAAEWTQETLKDLCEQYGAIQLVRADGPGAFVVSFASTDVAKSASECLEGLKLENDGGTCSIVQARLLPERKEGDMEVDEVPPDLLSSALSENGGPVVAYVDELQLAQGEPRPEDREVFLRELPLEDYTEMQLREWLSGFGAVTACHFVRSPQTQELTGCGYVTFASHAEAAGLLAAFPQGSDNDGNVKGSWSLSERMVQGEQGLFKADVVGAISKCIRQSRADIFSAALLFVGGANEGPPALTTWELGSGPLHFVCSGRHRFQSSKELRDYFADLVSNVLADASLGKQTGIADMTLADLGLDSEPATPCILLHGFPASWVEQQVRLVFSVFGGISSVRFMPAPNNPKSRVALVELKDPSNAAKAVSQLDNSQVGDGELIEECTVACKAFGVASATKADTINFHHIFLDEIVNLSQTQMPPGKADREVFVQSLPVEDCSEDQIRTWLEGFGPVEEMYLLREQATNELNGKGYVTYKTHAAACACIQAQASVQDVEDGDVVARWSESARAKQQKESVYGADLCSVAFPQRALDTIRRRVKAKNVWLLGSDRQPPKPRREGQLVPKVETSQLQFVVECDAAAQVEDVRRELSKLMTDFQRRQDAMKSAPPPNGAPPPGAPPPGAPAPWMPFGWRPYGPPPTSWAPPGYGQPPPPAPPAANGVVGSGWGAPTPAHAPEAPAVPDASQQKNEDGHKSRHRRKSHKPNADPAESYQAKIDRGEACIQEARGMKEREGRKRKAYKKFFSGIECLLEAMKLMSEGPERETLNGRIAKYMQELEEIKASMPREGKPQSKEDRAPSATLSPVAKRSRSHHRAEAKEENQISDVDEDPALRAKLDKAEALAHSAKAAETNGALEEAYSLLSDGIESFRQVLPSLKDAKAEVLQAKVDMYLARAEKIKFAIATKEKSPEKSASREKSASPAPNPDVKRVSLSPSQSIEKEKTPSRSPSQSEIRRKKVKSSSPRKSRDRSRSRSRKVTSPAAKRSRVRSRSRTRSRQCRSRSRSRSRRRFNRRSQSRGPGRRGGSRGRRSRSRRSGRRSRDRRPSRRRR